MRISPQEVSRVAKLCMRGPPTVDRQGASHNNRERERERDQQKKSDIMVCLLDIVSDKSFKLSANSSTVCDSIVTVIHKQTGVLIHTSRNCPISRVSMVLANKFKIKKYSKERFMEREAKWLKDREIEVILIWVQ